MDCTAKEKRDARAGDAVVSLVEREGSSDVNACMVILVGLTHTCPSHC